MEKRPRCARAQRFLLTQTLARKLAPLGASVIEENGDRRLVITFKSLQELKAKRQRVTSVLRQYKELIEEEPGLLKAPTVDEPEGIKRYNQSYRLKGRKAGVRKTQEKITENGQKKDCLHKGRKR